MMMIDFSAELFAVCFAFGVAGVVQTEIP